MTYPEFRALVAARGWTVRQLRSDDAPPGEELFNLMIDMGLDRYERFVLRLLREQPSAAAPRRVRNELA